MNYLYRLFNLSQDDLGYSTANVKNVSAMLENAADSSDEDEDYE